MAKKVAKIKTKSTLTSGAAAGQQDLTAKTPRAGKITVLNKKVGLGARKGCFELDALLSSKLHFYLGIQTPVRTGIKVQLKPGMFAMLVPSEGMSKMGIQMSPAVQMITSTDEVVVTMINKGTFVQDIENGAHIVDMFILAGTNDKIDIVMPKPEEEKKDS